MLQRPRFKPHIRVATVAGEGVYLLSEGGVTVLHGRTTELLASLIDGQRTSDDLVDQLATRVSAPELYYALLQLEREGHLVESDFAEVETKAWWTAQGVEARTASERLAEQSVQVTYLADLPTERLEATLQALGVAVGEEGDFRIVVIQDYLRNALSDINRNALASGQPWLLIKPVGSTLWLGPLFRPMQTACWECMANRMRANRATDMYLQDSLASGDTLDLPQAWTSATLQMAFSSVAIEVAQWLVKGTSSLESQLVSFDLRTGESKAHTVVRRPQCPACGKPNEDKRSVEPVLFESSLRKYFRGGSHRTLDPEETLARLERHVSPLTGIVQAVDRLAVFENDVVSVYSSSHGMPGPKLSLNDVRNAHRRSCGGKGVNDVQSRVSALCEAIERYSATFTGCEARFSATQKELGDTALDPNKYTLFSDCQFKMRDEWNAKQGYFCTVPMPLHPEAAIEWSPLWSLSKKRVRYLPTGLCYLGYPLNGGQDSYIQTANGLGAGNTIEEAVLHGFLELVERDSAAIWWYNRLSLPAVDWRSFGDEYVNQIDGMLRRRGRTMWILDLTTDLEIHTFAAISIRIDASPEGIVMGFGAHLNPSVALLRAVSEMVQMLAWITTPGADERVSEGQFAPIAVDWLENASVAVESYLQPDPSMPARSREAYRDLSAEDLRDDLTYCQSVVERHGMEMLVLDMTRADTDLAVVRVIVPGLRPLWARFAPGRLYDVPVRQGYRAEQLDESQLNPIPMFL